MHQAEAGKLPESSRMCSFSWTEPAMVGSPTRALTFKMSPELNLHWQTLPFRFHSEFLLLSCLFFLPGHQWYMKSKFLQQPCPANKAWGTRISHLVHLCLFLLTNKGKKCFFQCELTLWCFWDQSFVNKASSLSPNHLLVEGTGYSYMCKDASSFETTLDGCKYAIQKGLTTDLDKTSVFIVIRFLWITFFFFPVWTTWFLLVWNSLQSPGLL